MWPLAIDEATLLGGEEAQALTGVGAARSALRLSLRCLGEYRWDELSIERLRIHLAASPMGCAILYDLLAAHAVQVMAGAPGTPPAALRGLPEIVGFAADEALLPEEDGGHPGLRLLAEYFAFPDKFHFFDLPLSGALADGQTLYLYLVFDRAPTARLHLQAEDFQLGCAPAINLFPRTSEPLRRTAPAASTAWSPTVTARTAWKSIASAPCARLPGAPCSQSRPTMAAATTATSARSTGTPGASPG